MDVRIHNTLIVALITCAAALSYSNPLLHAERPKSVAVSTTHWHDLIRKARVVHDAIDSAADPGHLRDDEGFRLD